MANREHLKILKQGVKAWNEWREKNPHVMPDLSNAKLGSIDLAGANLNGSTFRDADMYLANLKGADIQWGSLIGANLERADLSSANLSREDINGANLTHANLRDANLYEAEIFQVNFTGADLNGADFTGAKTGGAIFGDNDLSGVKGLGEVEHYTPSTVGVDTLYLSGGKIPDVFLRGCGVPENFIPFIKSHIGAEQAVQFYSCFISYSQKDEEFAKRLYSRLRDANLRVWFAPEDVKGGEKLYEQIDRAIQVHDRLLLVLSENSLQSKWVITEIRKARKVEIEENRKKLFPIRLFEYEKLQDWECFDARYGEDLAVEVRRYFIPDFSNWKDHDAFESAFDKLLQDLRTAETIPN